MSRPVTRILELVRDDRDRPLWRPVATVAHRGHLEEPRRGTYRLERAGARLEVHHTGGRSA